MELIDTLLCTKVLNVKVEEYLKNLNDLTKHIIFPLSVLN